MGKLTQRGARMYPCWHRTLSHNHHRATVAGVGVTFSVSLTYFLQHMHGRWDPTDMPNQNRPYWHLSHTMVHAG